MFRFFDIDVSFEPYNGSFLQLSDFNPESFLTVS